MTPAYARAGSGPVVVLLHALGASRRSWHPVLDALAERFDVIAVDLPGFGESPVLPADVEPTPAALAAAVGELLDELEVHRPHVVGNSIGGWVALELAEVREVASLTLLAPAGLWRDRTPRYCWLSLWLTGWLARHLTSLLVRAVGTRAGRVLVLGQTHGRPAAISADYARDAVRDLAASAGFFPTLQATLPRHYAARGALDAPVTVVFGSRDLVLLPWQARQLEQLPPHRRAADLARCGHLPMADDPAAVVASIVASTAAFRADNAGSG